MNYAPKVTGSDDALEYAGSTLILESEIKVRHYFKLKDGQTYSSTLTQYTEPGVDGTYYFFEKEFVATKLGDMTSYIVEGTNITFEYCPLSYVTTLLAEKNSNSTGAYSEVENDTNLRDLTKSLYLYYQETVAYNAN